MTSNTSSRYAPGYDLFKLITAILLTILLIILLLRNRQSQNVVIVITATQPVVTETSPVTKTLLPATFTLTIEPTSTLTQTSTVTPTIPLIPTLVPTETPVPTQAVGIVTAGPSNCPSAASRIQVGDVVNILHRLNLRTGPGLSWQIILTNNPSVKLEVIGGPTCTPQTTSNGETKAHLWWLVRMENGQVGWSAEGQLLATNYLLEPIR